MAIFRLKKLPPIPSPSLKVSNNRVRSNNLDGDIDDDFRAYDDLPEHLRMLLQEYVAKFYSVDVLARIHLFGENKVRQELVAMELKEIMRTAYDYKRRYLVDYPHTAAFATVLRYGPKIRPRKRILARHVMILRKLGQLEGEEGIY